ncbi:MAG: histidine--tRNA ligase [Patescibacteria group bacterium]|nr:histidine--tRNA ligase [Patescibacteria group bacterium]MDE1944500.1 histidine--tRNA ligase [Patescibacteria group bacterium]MDE1945401.1 histidine--tRNA ligase [Patescibacteria group bacterium]MDE2057766.1 histidine--tRNA ligase [Patescibacteria group bacterium]
MRDKLSTEPYKGVRDFYPEEQAFLNYFMRVARQVLESAGYVEYGASILEPAELYKAKGAENEEIVSEQTYTFTDRGEREVTLRPEMTPTVARMVAAKRRSLGFPLRFFSIPNVFRYERPQKGRLREHWQLNVDLFGSRSVSADAEIIRIAHDLLISFGAKDGEFEIQVNDRRIMEDLLNKIVGIESSETRQVIRLLDRFEKAKAETTAKIAELIGDQKLARLIEALSGETTMNRLHAVSEPFEAFQNMRTELAAAEIKTRYNHALTRGFDYYTGMVFEVFDTSGENTRSLFGGGRYDNLTQLFDDEPLPGVGFGMGDVTLYDFLKTHELLPAYRPPTDLYIAITSPEYALAAQTFAGELRGAGVNTAIDFGEKKNVGDQIKTAAKHQIPYVIVLGPDELASGQVKLRDLASGQERALARGEVAAAIRGA